MASPQQPSSSSPDYEKVIAASAGHPKPQSITYTYGTAGFRMKADILDSVMFRVGLLAVLRSKALHGKVIGIMVTASHNPEQDNGVKLVDPLGEMLEQTWESYATQLANAATAEDLVKALKNVIEKESIAFGAHPAKVVVGRDTRPSGVALVKALKDGIEALGGKCTDYGINSTPQLHYITRCLNTLNTPDAYGEPSEEGYYTKLATAFKKIVAGKPRLSKIYVDAANGVGAEKLIELAKHIGEETLSVEIVNADTKSSGKLNHNCGADHVKLYQKKPEGLDMKPGMRCCSLDGDADRVVYYFVEEDGTFRLLDGDKIATLAAAYIIDLVRAAKITGLQVGVVQTAYANGSSTRYIQEELKIPVSCVPTGVKHLHHEAEEKYDVGVYFEANGHGTVLFSKKALTAFKEAKGTNDTEQTAIEKLQCLAVVINQAVGDALSDMLMVEAILTNKSWTELTQWNAKYTDLPSRQEKVKVSNRNMFKTIKADTELSEPAALQASVNEQVAKYKHGRCFVRPSGTEDIVRVYAEADTQENTDKLAYTVAGIVFDHYGGVGERPAKYPKA